MPGAGLYEVGPGKTYATIQAALDQLWTDQGGADFAATQEIRIYDDTYNEAVTLNSGLRPTSRYKLKVQAASGNDAVVVTNSGLGAGSHTFNNNSVDSVEYRNIEIREVVAGGAYAIVHVGIGCTIDACTLDGEGTGYAATYAGTGCLIRDCTIKRITIGLRYGEWRVERCLFQDMTDRVLWETTSPLQLEGCVFDNCSYAVFFFNANTSPPPEFSADVRNCTFYSCPYPFHFGGSAGNRNMRLRAFNNVFKDSSTVFYSLGGIARVQSDRNCFHGNTGVAYFDSIAYTTLADWQAVTDEDGNSPDASSLAADPLLTDPAADDFTLQAASPCRGPGIGAGVTRYVDGIPAHAHHPNIGASGTADDPPAPAWAADTSNVAVTDAKEGDDVAATWDAASIGGAGLSIEYCLEYRIGAGAWTRGWIGAGTSVPLGGLTENQEYEFRVGARAADYEQAWRYPTDSDTATPTRPVAAPAISGVAVTATTVTLTVTAGGTAKVGAKLIDSAGTEIDEQFRTGAGDIVLTPSASGKHYVSIWGADASDVPRTEPDTWHRAVIVPGATESEWKAAAAAIASELDDYTTVKVVIPNQRFNPASETEFMEVGRPRFAGGGGRRGERLTAVTVDVWCSAKAGGDRRNLARALELADVVEGALGEADIEIETDKWLRFQKAAVTSEGEAEYQGAMLHVARVALEGTYQCG